MTPISASSYRRKDYVVPRTQAEAGIDRQAWEDRLGPLRSWLKDVGACLCLVAIIVAFMFVANHLPQWADVIEGVLQ